MAKGADGVLVVYPQLITLSASGQLGGHRRLTIKNKGSVALSIVVTQPKTDAFGLLDASGEDVFTELVFTVGPSEAKFVFVCLRPGNADVLEDALTVISDMGQVDVTIRRQAEGASRTPGAGVELLRQSLAVKPSSLPAGGGGERVPWHEPQEPTGGSSLDIVDWGSGREPVFFMDGVYYDANGLVLNRTRPVPVYVTEGAM